MTTLDRGQLMNDEQYLEAIEENGDEFDARMGAEAVYELLKTINLTREIDMLREEIVSTTRKPS